MYRGGWRQYRVGTPDGGIGLGGRGEASLEHGLRKPDGKDWVDQANLETAWKNVRANRGAPGPDGVTVDEFPETFRPQWPKIRRQLLEGAYRPGAARRKSISKPDGGQRNLGIPNVIDRLILQAILQVITPFFDPGFSESSFGFRPGRSAHGAAKQVQSHIRAGYRQCVDMDLSKFFDQSS